MPEGAIEKFIRAVYPDKILVSHQLISGGCANLNIKVHLHDDLLPLILRVYLRDKDACYREQKLGQMLYDDVPVPRIYQIGEVDGYRFAFAELMPGITLRELLLGDFPHDVKDVMIDVGKILSKIATHEFSNGGFFDAKLNVVPFTASEDYLSFARNCLKDGMVTSLLKPSTIIHINNCLDMYGHLFPYDSKKHLVHADFDPSNILVDQFDGAWKVSGVLDWEFAFSGSVLCDVANMLRYAHQMSPVFEDAFLKGLTDGGVVLPDNWRITAYLLNLVSLLDLLKQFDIEKRPAQFADISKLINYVLAELN